MSIRLRFTLLYNVILFLTLAALGSALYLIQAETTLQTLRQEILWASDPLGATLQRLAATTDFQNLQTFPQPPAPFGVFPNEPTLNKPRERELVRILDTQGALVLSPFGASDESALPLSAAGLQALQNGQDWWETGMVNAEPYLIYNRPLSVGGQVVYIMQVARSLAERNAALNNLGITLVLASLVTLLLAFGVGWAFSGIVLRPIQRITHTAQMIGAKQDLTQRVDYTGPADEVGQLATTFNTMLARLQEAYQRVAYALEMQRNFVADVSHELRTPLTTLRGNLGLLRRTPPIPAEEQADILTDMVDESDRLIRLVNDLLVLARAEAGRSLTLEVIAVPVLLEEVCRQARQLEPERALTCSAPQDLVLSAERDALKQVLLAAVDNALKHSTGAVELSAVRQGAQVELRVHDSGQGIEPEQLAHIFERFYRGADVGGTPGFGLGLAIAKALVEGQGGTIAMESQPGQGSTLIVRLSA